jgi:uncharacterized coiled-coil protein SlyX
MPVNEERIVALEMHAAQQEALLEDLSAVLHEQQLEIRALQEELRRMSGRLEQTESRTSVPRPEKPPHY